MQETKHKPDKKAKKSLNSYARYSTLSFQMIVIIIGGTLGGNKLDQYFEFQKPVLTIVFSLLSVSIALYIGIKTLIK